MPPPSVPAIEPPLTPAPFTAYFLAFPTADIPQGLLMNLRKMPRKLRPILENLSAFHLSQSWAEVGEEARRFLLESALEV